MTIERGFCTSREYLQSLEESGLPPKLIYLSGRGAETLEACLDSFRGRPGTLHIAPDARVLGTAKATVAEVMARLEKARIRVTDVIHPQDDTVSAMLQRAFVRISSSRFRDPRTARRRGATGGLAKGEIARSNRAQIDTDTLISNLVAEHGVIGWAMIERILDGKISRSTLRRHYMVRGRA